MYADVLKLRSVRALVRKGGDAYRDLMMIRGRCLKLVHAERETPLSISEVQELKMRVMFEFASELERVISDTIPAPTKQERRQLDEFQARCTTTVRNTVLHLR
jgi:hypothetical protein